MHVELFEARVVPATLDIRTYDGTSNNLTNVAWGSSGTQLVRVSPVAYGDGISTPAGSTLPSPRLVSNVLADASVSNPISAAGLSAMVYAWGQFLDHDIGLTPTNGTEKLSIRVPTGDPSFDPNSTGTKTIGTTRSVFDPTTGTSTANPRQQINTIAAWIDGSQVYGSTEARSLALRTLQGGRLKTSAGNLLPVNNAATFPNGTVKMGNDAHVVPDDQLFAAGDERANENIELTAMQTLFVREHNRVAQRIAAANPGMSDEQIFQQARSIAIGEIQAITYNEWLPALLGPNALKPYRGYDATVNPQLANEFSTAAFRFGHSLLADDVQFLNNAGSTIRDGVSLAQAFSNPPLVVQNGIDPLLKYLASDPASEFDSKVVDGVRNFLFGPPGSGGFDLASLNIERGRDHGLSDYNTVRAAYGLPRITAFSQITANVTQQEKLRSLYGSIDKIDLWVGVLAEDHVAGGSVGPTARAILSEQFERLRTADRFWYQRTFVGPQLREIEGTRLSDIIRNNTTVSNLQTDVFSFKASVSGTLFTDTNGNRRLDRNEPPRAGLIVQLIDPTGVVAATTTTDSKGMYSFNVLDGLRTGEFVVRTTDTSGVKHNQPAIVTRGDVRLTGVDLALPGPKLMVVTSGATVEMYRGLDRTNAIRIQPFGEFAGGIHVAVGDLNGDGIPEVVLGAGEGGGPRIVVVDGQNGQILSSFFAYESTFRGGVNVAVGDVDGDGVAEIITGAGTGGGPRVRILHANDFSEMDSFFAYDSSFRGGVTVAAADTTGDGMADIVTGAGKGGGPNVRVFDGKTRREASSFFAFDPQFQGGVTIAVGDLNGDGHAEIVVGAGVGGKPQVKIFDPTTDQTREFLAYEETFTGGVNVAIGDLNGDGRADILTGAGPGGGPHLRILDSTNLSEIDSYFATDYGFLGGVYVGCG